MKISVSRHFINFNFLHVFLSTNTYVYVCMNLHTHVNPSIILFLKICLQLITFVAHYYLVDIHITVTVLMARLKYGIQADASSYICPWYFDSRPTI
jgi:hypothetical protein